MRVLLDTCVLSEIQRSQGSPQVKRAVAALLPEDTFISVITVGEIAAGIAQLDTGSRRRALAEWLDGLEQAYGKNVLDVDAETARFWGALTARARQAGRPLAAPDGLIAATAHCHGLQVMTRNVSDFAETGVVVVGPWEGA